MQHIKFLSPDGGVGLGEGGGMKNVGGGMERLLLTGKEPFGYEFVCASELERLAQLCSNIAVGFDRGEVGGGHVKRRSSCGMRWKNDLGTLRVHEEWRVVFCFG